MLLLKMYSYKISCRKYSGLLRIQLQKYSTISSMKESMCILVMYSFVYCCSIVCRQLSTFCDSYVKSIAETEVNLFKDFSKGYFQIISQGNVSLCVCDHIIVHIVSYKRFVEENF